MTGPVDATSIRTQENRRMALSEETEEVLARLKVSRTQSGGLTPLSYNLTISHRHRFVWFRNAKVGTRTILDYLVQLDPDRELVVASNIPYPTAAFVGYYKFAMVRHPLDRFISAWQDKVHASNIFEFDKATHERMRTIENFAAWVAEKNLRSSRRVNRHLIQQSRAIDLSHIDFVGRLESFDDDFAMVCREIGVPVRTLVPRNQSKPQGVTRANASQELRSMVEEMYRRDYQIFGY